MSVLDEVLAANDAYASDFGDKGELGMPPARGFADPDLHGRPPGPGEVRRPGRGRRARHPQRRRPRERRRDPLARHLLQAARHPRVVRHPPHELRHGVLHRRGHARPARQQPRDRRARRRGLLRRRRGPRLRRGQAHRLADDLRPGAERRRGRQADPQPPARPGRHPGLRLHLRRRDGPPRRGAGRRRPAGRRDTKPRVSRPSATSAPPVSFGRGCASGDMPTARTSEPCWASPAARSAPRGVRRLRRAGGRAGRLGRHLQRGARARQQRGPRRRPAAAQRDAGIGIVRQPFSWARIETAPGVLDFAVYDKVMAAAASAGLAVLPVVMDPPPWRSTAPATGALRRRCTRRATPAAMAVLAAAARAALRAGRQASGPRTPSSPPSPIRSWQVWNEPNIPAFWATGPDPAAYVRLLAGGRRRDPRRRPVRRGRRRPGCPYVRHAASRCRRSSTRCTRPARAARSTRSRSIPTRPTPPACSSILRLARAAARPPRRSAAPDLGDRVRLGDGRAARHDHGVRGGPGRRCCATRSPRCSGRAASLRLRGFVVVSLAATWR